MFSNITPLNWFNTLRRLKKEGNFDGHLGKELGLLPGRKAFASQLQGVTKHKPTRILTEAATPETKHVKPHKPRKGIKAMLAQSGAIGEDGEPHGEDGEPHELYSFPALSPDSAPAASPVSAATHRTLLSPVSSSFRQRLDTVAPHTSPAKVAHDEEYLRAEAESKGQTEKAREHEERMAKERKMLIERLALGRQARKQAAALRVDKANKEIATKAATKIQAVGRGRKARLTVAALKANRSTGGSSAPAAEAPRSPGASVRDATAVLLSPSMAETRRTPRPTPPSPQDPMERMEAGLPPKTVPPKVSGGQFKAPSGRKVRTETEVLGALSRALFGPPSRVRAVLPTNSPPKLRPLGAARAAAAAKPTKSSPQKVAKKTPSPAKASPAKSTAKKSPVRTSPTKEPSALALKIKKAAQEKTKQEAEEKAKAALHEAQPAAAPAPAPKTPTTVLAILLKAKWPGTLRMARQVLTDAEIEAKIGEPITSMNHTPEKTRKLKLALREYFKSK